MFVRLLLSALAALALVSGAAGQSCPTSQALETCTSSQMSSTGTSAGSGTATLNLGFTYCAPQIGYGVGTILALQSGTLAINGGNGGGISSYSVQALTGGITTGAPGSVTIPSGNGATLGVGQAPILSFSNNGVAARITINGQTVSIVSNSPSVILAGVQIPLSTATLPSGLQNFNQVSQDSCTAIRGDPQFVGLRGQSYQVHGVDGGVYNLISDLSTQVNSRFVFLTEGECPTVNGKLDTVGCWSHPGSYMGELSFQVVVDGKLHAALVSAGDAKKGFSVVQMDGKAVKAGETVSFGAFSLTYTNAHTAHITLDQYIIDLSNSDKFLNLALQAKVPLSQLKSHGLIGQTHSTKTYKNTVKYVEGEIDDYMVTDDDVFGTSFPFNQFQA